MLRQRAREGLGKHVSVLLAGLAGHEGVDVGEEEDDGNEDVETVKQPDAVVGVAEAPADGEKEVEGCQEEDPLSHPA